jgi:hypothetical protein
MQQIRLISVAFDTEIAPHETAAFRGAVIEKVGYDRELYHNHNNDPQAERLYHYRYPLVQYKRQRRRPAILFIDEGVNEAQHFFSNPDWQLNFAGRDYQASVADLRVKQYKLGVCDRPRYYTLRRWAALNQSNFERFLAIESDEARKAFLERMLVGHILGFGKGVGHRYEKRVEARILDIFRQRSIPMGGVRMLTCDIRFEANVMLPAQIGLGKGAARGFGILSYWNPDKEQKPTI